MKQIIAIIFMIYSLNTLAQHTGSIPPLVNPWMDPQRGAGNILNISDKSNAQMLSQYLIDVGNIFKLKDNDCGNRLKNNNLIHFYYMVGAPYLLQKHSFAAEVIAGDDCPESDKGKFKEYFSCIFSDPENAKKLKKLIEEPHFMTEIRIEFNIDEKTAIGIKKVYAEILDQVIQRDIKLKTIEKMK